MNLGQEWQPAGFYAALVSVWLGPQSMDHIQVCHKVVDSCLQWSLDTMPKRTLTSLLLLSLSPELNLAYLPCMSFLADVSPEKIQNKGCY